MKSWCLRVVVFVSLLAAVSACSDSGGQSSTEASRADATLSDAADAASVDAGDTTVDTTAQPDSGLDAADTTSDVAPQAIALDIDFTGGSLDVANSTVSDDTIELAGRSSFYDGKWKWFYFRASHVAGKHPQFSIPTNFAGDASELAGHQMVYSEDGSTWKFFDNNQVDAQAGEFRFWNNGDFGSDAVFVAFGIPYTVDDAAALVADMKQSQWASPTASASPPATPRSSDARPCATDGRSSTPSSP